MYLVIYVFLATVCTPSCYSVHMQINQLYTDPEQLSSSKTKKTKIRDKNNGKIVKHYCMLHKDHFIVHI